MILRGDFMSIILTLCEEVKKDRNGKGKSLIAFPDNYCVIDLETTGLDPEFDGIIEMAAIKVENNKIVDTFTSLINIEDNELDEYITELTGITLEMLKEAPHADTVLSDFLDFVGNYTLVGHNVNFDINFIYDAVKIVLDKTFSNNFVDTLRLSRRLLELKNHKLSTIADNFNIDYSNAHRALSDCEITYKCFCSLREEAIKQHTSIDLFLKSCKRHNFKISDVSAQTTEFDTENPFYNKVCVFTGALDKMPRRDAVQLVLNLGGICKNTVSRKTDYLILGNTDYCNNLKGDKTKKLKQAQDLKLKGENIEILTENVFYDLLSQNN